MDGDVQAAVANGAARTTSAARRPNSACILKAVNGGRSASSTRDSTATPRSSATPDARHSRRPREALHIVCASVGFDVGGEAIPYVAGWGEDGELDAIREYAQTIDTIARRIAAALAPEPEPATEASALDVLAA